MDNTTTPSTENPDNVTPPTDPTPMPPVEPAPPVDEPTQPAEPSTPAPETPAVQPVVAEHGSKKGALKKFLVAVLVLLLAALAAGAVYMWQQNKVDDLNAQLKTAKSTSSTNAAASTAATTDPDLTKSTKLVKDFYAAYNKSVGDQSTDSQAVITKYGNANLAFYKKYYNFGFDPIICGQDVLPDTYTVSGSKSEDGVATVLVKVSNTDSITVHVVDQGGLKVDGVTCYGEAAKQDPHPANN